MTHNSNGPNNSTRFISHALVGSAAFGVVGLFVLRRNTPQAQLFGALVAIMMHEMLDAPVAAKLVAYGL
jgi:hypothetical protein